jgi:ATP-binding cassette, subfamily B, bacterial
MPISSKAIRRTLGRGFFSVVQGVADAGNLLSSAVSLAAAIVTAGLLNPVLAPVVLIAAAPNGWASTRAAMLSDEAFVPMISRTRRMNIVGDLMTNRREAAEVRAFTTQKHPARRASSHRRPAHGPSGRRRAPQDGDPLVGRGLAGIGTALAYAVLGVLLHARAMPLALAGAVAVAMRTASSTPSCSSCRPRAYLDADNFKLLAIRTAHESIHVADRRWEQLIRVAFGIVLRLVSQCSRFCQ